MKNTLNKLARFISTLFVPPSFTIIVFTLFAFIFESEILQRIIVILVAFIFGFIAQIILFLVFRKRGRIVDLDASVKEERTTPFLISIGFYFIGLIILIVAHVNILSIAFWFCYLSNTFFTILINKHWKISAHAMGAAGPLAAVTYAFGPLVLAFIILVAMIAWSRIQLKVHTLPQVLIGILFAFASTYLQILLVVKWFS